MRELTSLMILSAELERRSVGANDEATTQLEAGLQKVGLMYKKVKGVYKGRAGESFVVTTPTASDELAVYKLAEYFGQESVLFVNKLRDAELYNFTEDQFELLGKLTAVSESAAKSSDSYTFDPISGSYFTIKPI